MYFCHFKFLFSNERLDFLDFFKQKIKRINNADLFPQPSLIIFTKGTNNSDHACICIHICMYIHMCICIYIYIYIHTYIYIYVCVCVYVCFDFVWQLRFYVGCVHSLPPTPPLIFAWPLMGVRLRTITLTPRHSVGDLVRLLWCPFHQRSVFWYPAHQTSFL